MRSLLPIAITALITLGCSGAGPPPPAGTGEAVYHQERCRRCHAIGGKGGGTGPALDTVGARRGREWLEAYLKEPTAKIPKSRMANPELTDDEIRLLVDYLMGL